MLERTSRKKSTRTRDELNQLCRRMSRAPSLHLESSPRERPATDGHSEDGEDFAKLSIEELRTKLEEAEERSFQNRQRLQAAGERGQELLLEESELGTRFEEIQSLLLKEAVDAIPEDDLPKTIHGHHGELHLPASVCGQRIYRQILQTHAETRRIGLEVVGMEAEIDECQEQPMMGKVSEKPVRIDWISTMRLISEDKWGNNGGNPNSKWKKVREKKGAELAELGRGTDQVLQRVHRLYDEVKEVSGNARKAALARAHERTHMERELIAARRKGNLTLAGLREELEATKERNVTLKQDLAEHRRFRAEHSASGQSTITQLQTELDDTNYGADRAEAEIDDMRREFAAAAADHHVAAVSKKVEVQLAQISPSVGVMPDPADDSVSEAESEVRSDASSEVWEGEQVFDGEHRRAAAPLVPSQHALGAHSHVAKAGHRRKARAEKLRKGGHHFHNVDVVVNTATEAHAAKEATLHAKLGEKHKAKEVAEDDGFAAWAACRMGDVLLKIDDMTRANEQQKSEATEQKKEVFINTFPKEGPGRRGRRKKNDGAEANQQTAEADEQKKEVFIRTFPKEAPGRRERRKPK